MTAALLAAVLTMTAAQGLAASEDSTQVQEQAEPAAKQAEAKKAEAEKHAQEKAPVQQSAPAPQAGTAKQPEPKPAEAAKPAEAPAPQAEAAKQPEPKPAEAAKPAETAESNEKGQEPEAAAAGTTETGTPAAENTDSKDTAAGTAETGTPAAETANPNNPAAEITEPENPEKKDPEEEKTEPEGTEPEGTEPEGTEPEGTEPEGTVPEGTEPEETELEETEAEVPETEVPEEKLEAAEAGDVDLGLKNISIADDSRGTYIEYEFGNTEELSTELTFMLVDIDGNRIGSSFSKTTDGKESARIYIIGLDQNLFHLEESEMGRTVSVRVKARNDAGSQNVLGQGIVKLRKPVISMPAVISYGVVTKPDDMYDVTKVSGVTFDTGSCVTQRILEKVSGGSSTQIPSTQTLTGDDAGTYQFRIRSFFGDIVSNRFLFTVPATGLSVDGDIRIGSELRAAPAGVNGYAPTELTYAWTFAGSREPVCTEAVYTPSLKEAVEAQTLSLTLTIRDAVGNVFDHAMELAPMDLSAANLTTEVTGLTYTGISQIPADAGVLVDGFRIPESLYTLAPAPGKNTTEAGTAWMQVSGENAYLTNSGIVSYEIAPASAGLGRGDFVRSFAYDGAAHRPVLKSDAEPETKVRLVYRKWKRKNGSGWASMNGAPVEPGTYRVDVTIVPKDANYGQVVLKKMVFTITGEVKTEQQEAKPDLTVTDRYGNPAAYTVQVIAPPPEEPEAPSIYQITASLDRTAADQDQENALERSRSVMRCLNITGELLAKAEAAGCRMLRFALGGAAVEMDMDALKAGAPHRLELASVQEEDISPEEKELLAEYETAGDVYAVRLSSTTHGSGQEAAEEDPLTLTAYLDVLPEDRDQIKGCLFLKEEGTNAKEDPDAQDETEPRIVAGSLSESEDSMSYSAELDPAGVFCLVRETGSDR